MIAHSSHSERRRTWTEDRLTGRLPCPEACTFTTSGDRPQALTAHFGDRRPRRETAVFRVLRLRQGSSMVASPQAVENNRTRTRAFLKRVGWAALAARRGCRVCRVHVSGRAPETRMPRVPMSCATTALGPNIGLVIASGTVMARAADTSWPAVAAAIALGTRLSPCGCCSSGGALGGLGLL